MRREQTTCALEDVIGKGVWVGLKFSSQSGGGAGLTLQQEPAAGGGGGWGGGSGPGRCAGMKRSEEEKGFYFTGDGE